MIRAGFNELFKAALITARMCVVQPDERVVIFTDTEKDVKIVDAFETAVSAITDPVLVRTKPFPHLTDPPRLAIEAMSSADMVFDLASRAWLYTKATEEILAAGTRMLQVVNRTERGIIDRPPLAEVVERSKKAQSILTTCSTVRILTPGGGDLQFYRGDRPIWRQAGVVDKEKRWDSYGIALAAFSPLETQGSGNVFFNGSFSMPPHGSYHVERPFEVQVSDGKISQIETQNLQGRLLEQWLQSWADPNMYRVAHVGFGLDPRITPLAENPGDLESMLGAITIAFGSNQVPFLKGENPAPSHTDVNILNADFAADGLWLLRGGQFTEESGLR